MANCPLAHFIAERPDAAGLWLSLREDSKTKLLKEDSMIARELKVIVVTYTTEKVVPTGLLSYHGRARICSVVYHPISSAWRSNFWR